jgi:PadR family transcriptional regulator, regulatory protein PadR
MTKQMQQRAKLLQGTLDMLILRTLLYGPAHGHQIGKHIQRTTNDFSADATRFALSGIAPSGGERLGGRKMGDGTRPQSRVQVLPIDGKGPEAAVAEESQWKQMAEAVARIMWPALEEG